jgi:DNA invertase Pin-like site-specific DNA recombinase
MEKKLRFAALIRVSTEQQKDQGESLRTQETQITTSVEMLGGVITKTYAGHEHATEGYEKKRFDQLLTDAAKSRKQFDAVIVADPSRWSRDNANSSNGLNILRDNGIRFFYMTTEVDLFNAQQKGIFGVQTAINSMMAAIQKEKSVINKIARAKRGIPTGGSLPYGRTFDKTTETWGINNEKKAIIKDSAKRYLAGESLTNLAAEYGMDHTNLHMTLTRKCGPDWGIHFNVPDLNIDEYIPINVPALLPNKAIDAILKQAAANKTYHHGSIKYKYLLSRMIFCDKCGRAMHGQNSEQRWTYYRHAPDKGACKCPKRSIPADVVEENIIRNLFETFANHTAVKGAIEAATPNK